MYKCENCECVFEDANTVTEYRGECHGSPAYETYSVCPFCGSTDFYEISEYGREDDFEI